MSREAVLLAPIGFVERSEEPPPGLDAWSESEWLARRTARIRILPEYCEGLRGLEPGRYYWVIWYAHRAGTCGLLVHPYRDPRRPLTGVFATRSPCRPNPLALSLVLLLARRGCTLEVVGIDAYDSTPVLDIKPYSRSYDEPGWVG